VLEAERETASSFGLLIMGVATISLLVGGTGILALMLLSVKERTTEIGLRLAVGARRRDVLGQFLTEALALAAPGGGAGVVLGARGDTFNHMVRRVRDMVATRDELLLDVSHELRSPITRMKVALDLLPDSEKKQTLESDVAEVEAMITEILEIERLKDGRGGLRPQPHDVVQLVREAVDAFGDRGSGVRLAGSPGEVMLEVDAGRVKTVLKNLLENAVNLSPPDSQPVEVSVTENEGKLVVGIEDDGPGIPPADLPHLFEPFFRVDRSRSKRTGGYGLGLSMWKRIMEAHGGNIAAENIPDRGARFVLTFPK